MIIFTITNKVTDQVFVGSTRNSLESQWAKIISAAEQGLDYPLYRQICRHGAEHFEVEEWDYAETREELLTLEQEAIDSLGAESLRGYKTAVNQKRVPTPKKRTAKPKPSTNNATSSSNEDSIKVDADNATKEAKQEEVAEPAPKPVAAPIEKPVSILAQLTANAKAYKKSKPIETTQAIAKGSIEGKEKTAGFEEIESDQFDSLLAKVNAYSSQAKTTQEQTAEEATVAEPQNPETSKVIEPVTNEHQQRILAAINKQRQLRSERTPTVIEQERKQLADLLTKLESRATELNQPVTGA